MARILFVLAFVLALAPQRALAQAPDPAVQALSACLTRSATAEDNVVLVRWIFVAMARHPSVSQYSAIPDADRVRANREVGALFNRLMLEACPAETRAAFQSAGVSALEAPFGALGERAMTEIMAHPDVNAAVIEMTSYLDQQSLGALIE